jgi:hypothetical protein
MGTNVLEEPAISVFRVKEYSLKLEPSDSSRMFIPTYQTTRDDVLEGSNLDIKISLREIVEDYIHKTGSGFFAINRF